MLSLPANQPWDDLLTLKPTQKSLISKIYTHLMAFDDYSAIKARTSWERELELNLTDELWEDAIHTAWSSTPSARLELIQLKVLHRTHLSKSRLSEIYPHVADQCDKCHASDCNLSHMFFLCPRLQKFWSDYSAIMSKVLGGEITVCPFVAIFGLSIDFPHINRSQSDVLAFTSLLARRRILLSWKSPKPPSISLWLRYYVLP